MKTSILIAAIAACALSAPIASAQDTATPDKPAMGMDMGLRADDTAAGVELVTREAEAVLRRWLAADPGLAELEVRPLSLEEAFVSLTQDPVAAGRLEQAA